MGFREGAVLHYNLFLLINLSTTASVAGIPPSQIADVAYSSINLSRVASLAISFDSFMFSFLAIKIFDGASIKQSRTNRGYIVLLFPIADIILVIVIILF